MIGIVFGLGFVLSFGYWTTNFVEVQRAMASSSISAAQRAPIIGSFPKMFIPFIVIFPGMIAGVLVAELANPPSGTAPDYNNSILYLMRDLLPNGMLGVAIAGLLASFMAGMAANISAFNTVFSYDLWQTYVKKDEPDDYYTRVGRHRDGRGDADRDRHGVLRLELHEHHGLPPDAVRVLQRPAVRDVHPRHVLEADDADGRLDWAWSAAPWPPSSSGCSARTRSDRCPSGLVGLSGQGASFVAAGAAFFVDIIVSVLVSMVTRPKPESELRGLVYSLTPKADFHDADEGTLPWYQKPNRARSRLARHGHRPQHRVLVRSPSMSSTAKNTGAPHKAGAFDIRNFIAMLIGIYGIVLVIAGLIGPSEAELEKADGLNINLYAGIGMVVVAAGVPALGPAASGRRARGPRGVGVRR